VKYFLPAIKIKLTNLLNRTEDNYAEYKDKVIFGRDDGWFVAGF
jgi:hypothetical protein